MKKVILSGMLALSCWMGQGAMAQGKHSFELSKTDFLLDGKPFQIISGEMHPARIPHEYWRHRIQMAKAMGCNTIAAYVFWNYHETEKGKFDFSTTNHNIAEFIKIAQQEGMWVMLRPGPYVCAEWEFGGLPSYLLQTPDIKVRCSDPRYLENVQRYVDALSAEIKPLLVTNGGPVVMVQVENEYGSYGNDKQYLYALKDMWVKNGINVPFYTADGPTPFMLEAGGVPGAAIGLDSGGSEADFEQAKKQNPNVPSFSSESYPGWLTHWGEQWQRPGTEGIAKEVKFLMDTKRSFNLYVIHGGTNFGYMAGANSGGKGGYEPDVTSYDYDAPINEQGDTTAKYMALRNLIGSYLPKGKKLPAIPKAIPTTTFAAVTLQPMTTVWDQLPEPVHTPQPVPFEALGQDYGFMVYKTKLIGHKSGKLTIKDLHDYATVFLNGKFVGKLDRRLGEKTIDLPKSDVQDPILEILVEGMGRINFAEAMIDRKGITDRVVLNGMTLMQWEQYKLPMNEQFIQQLQPKHGGNDSREGKFFKASFELPAANDTYIDMSAFKKGIVWVNGHNLGRYWEIGPQKHLYCPASWLKKGSNDIVVFDLLQQEPASVQGVRTLE